MGARFRRIGFGARVVAGVAAIFVVVGCNHQTSPAIDTPRAASPALASAVTAPAAETTGGFDGARAYKHVERLVALGPHPAGTDGIRRAQAYIIEQLKSVGCPVEEQDFHASTPIGDVVMKNILVKIPSPDPNIVIYASHYDTKRIDNFVGADDSGSSTGVLLELARILCARKNAQTIWLAFLDGEEAFNFQWADPDNTYGSRELAASLALSGTLRHVKAMILVDMVGPANPIFKRESNSTPWLTEILWSTAARLGYANVFVNESSTIADDHIAFLNRDVPAADIIDLEVPYWHTTGDTLDKIDPRTLAITGHVLIASLPELEKKIR
jgi:Zn-dependent M28 family amino/carboxypeptidase